MRGASNIDVLVRLEEAAMKTAALNPALVKALVAGGAGALLGAGGASLMHRHDEEDLARSKNTAFGAGIATGMAGPRIIDALHTATHPTQQVAGVPQ